MTKIQNIENALSLLEQAAAKHSEATEKGDYKAANKKLQFSYRRNNILKREK